VSELSELRLGTRLKSLTLPPQEVSEGLVQLVEGGAGRHLDAVLTDKLCTCELELVDQLPSLGRLGRVGLRLGLGDSLDGHRVG
jgi:hypothetical protein